MSLLAIEAEMLCTLAEKAADMLDNEDRCAPSEGSKDITGSIRKVSGRIREIIHEHPEDHDNEEHTAQFHREVASKGWVGKSDAD